MLIGLIAAVLVSLFLLWRYIVTVNALRKLGPRMYANLERAQAVLEIAIAVEKRCKELEQRCANIERGK